MDEELLRGGSAPEPESKSCDHCGQPCDRGAFASEGRQFCCLGCQTVFSLLRESGLDDYYRLGDRPGTRVERPAEAGRWEFLDDPTVAARLLDYQDGKLARVTLHLPAIHCVACVWLLENLFRLHAGIGRSRVNFARREVSIAYSPERAKLSEIAALLASLGYEPTLTLAELDRPQKRPIRRLGLQIAIAGFAFGNVMLFSLPLYLGLDSWSGPAFRVVFGMLSLVIALPAVVYSAADYWWSAWASLRQRALTLDVPIAAGLAAIYAQSAWEILGGFGEGYLDSLCGLIFFLLCGRAFQQKTHARLGFDRDYRGFFPLAVLRRTADGGEESVALSRVEVGDVLRVRHGELIPADARLVSGVGLLDYSFVTGESAAVSRAPGDHLYAGGRQTGGAIEIEILKAVSQSYLVSLWNEETFRKPRGNSFESLTNRYSRRFTWLVLAIALGSLLAWTLAGEASRGLKAFISVLIVACPCALALAAPFTLGTAQRLLARRGVFLRNGQVLETIAEIDAVMLDKTGTLTGSENQEVQFVGEPLSTEESRIIAWLCRQSTHPYSRRIAAWLGTAAASLETASVAGREYREEIGAGVETRVEGREILVGSLAWLRQRGVRGLRQEAVAAGVAVAVGGDFRGLFLFENPLRPAVDRLVRTLGERYHLALLTGDNERERGRFTELFGGRGTLHFNLAPKDKLQIVRDLQEQGRTVMMVGDGLNDAGALRQSQVGVAVVEGVGKFSPASDVILDARVVPGLDRILDFGQRARRVVRAGFVLSGAYNVIGVAIAAAGLLSPIVCAVLMPLSSVSVVILAVAATRWQARRCGLTQLEAPVGPRATERED